MIPQQCKRLAEVDFPIAAVSRHAAREKSIRHGHPSTLHLWWARRPLASSRAVLLGLLLPDPCDPHCPEAFKKEARKILPTVGCRRVKSDQAIRYSLLKFIADFANWDNSAEQIYLDAGRSLVRAAHGQAPPLVVDPFAGGGSIPLEALRLGCDAFASDLNPVACLILKVMLEDIPRHGPDLANDLCAIGAEIKQQAKQELSDLYPNDTDGATPIAYLWARTVSCEAPDCGAEIPLMRSFWLCRKTKRKRALRFSIKRNKGTPPQVTFDVFEPKTDGDVHAGTVTRAKATCLCCGTVLPPERVRTQLATERGGADVIFDEEGKRIGGARMTAVVTLRPHEAGRHYRLPTDADYAAVRKAQARVAKILGKWERGGRQGLCPVPNEPLPPIGTLGFRVQRYGMLKWGDLFTARQKIALVELTNLIRQAGSKSEIGLISAAISRCATHWSSGTMWIQDLEAVANIFGRQALPIVWDFAEACGFGDGGATLDGQVSWIAKVAGQLPIRKAANIQASDAADYPLPDQSATIWFTDPPYYDAVPYADLSDFFMVWLKRGLPNHPLLRDPYDPNNPLTPKDREAVQDETKKNDGRSKDRSWFEETMAKAFTEGRRVLTKDGVGSVVFAHKTTEGWEALLSGMIQGGWTITGSWPIATERAARMRAHDSAALATSIHLICRPRSSDALVGEWAEVLRELPLRVSKWMDRLQGEGVRGADLVFACIGPAIEIFSRYQTVETADGRSVGLPEYLEKVWEVVGRAALEQVLGVTEATARSGMAGALEEDARLTALFLWTLQSTEEFRMGNDREGSVASHPAVTENATPKELDGKDEEAVTKATMKGFHLPFDVVRRFSQPMGIDLERWTGRIISQEKGIVWLLPITERVKSLFGDEGSASVAEWVDNHPADDTQAVLFPDLDIPASPGHQPSRNAQDTDPILQSSDATILDRIHAAMLLQVGGYANALRTLIFQEQERGPDFLHLANALSALYPRGSREKRILDAMLLAVPK